MKKTKLFLIIALLASPVLFTGCGESKDTTVIEKADDPSGSGMSPEDEAAYKESMQQRRGGPGN